LFDHILAYRFLKEKDACRLFAQLISGVWYIHQQKLVHRDLKLENLLLDRNRNVIITDFGFANRFEHRADDLMQTSCGSTCHAAPELVISEGAYVGSTVDIWSCGVILYAVLAGYLPFDDDPANPDGDDINLLYKYIVNTPLSFPNYISRLPVTYWASCCSQTPSAVLISASLCNTLGWPRTPISLTRPSARLSLSRTSSPLLDTFIF